MVARRNVPKQLVGLLTAALLCVLFLQRRPLQTRAAAWRWSSATVPTRTRPSCPIQRPTQGGCRGPPRPRLRGDRGGGPRPARHAGAGGRVFGRAGGADTGLFYYAGHGLQVAGENYLVPVDARLQREAQVRLQTLPLETVLATMEAAVPTRLVLLDACRDNPLAQQLKRSMTASRSSSVGQGLAEIRTAVGTLIAYATGPGDVASDGRASTARSPRHCSITSPRPDWRCGLSLAGFARKC